jgi:hypothetical protein
MVHSLEQVADAIIDFIRKNAGSRTVLASDALTGTNVVNVDSTFRFRDAEGIVLIDIQDGHIEYHSILKVVDTTTLWVVNPVESDFTVANTATVQKAIAHVPLGDEDVLFGDREVIPNPDVTITVEPESMNDMEWMYIQGGLSIQHNVVVSIYSKSDEHENAARIVQKYADYIFDLFINKIHLDIVNDEILLAANVTAGDTDIHVADTAGWTDDISYRYELQDRINTEEDFSISQVLSGPPRLVLNRPTGLSYSTTEQALLRRRVRYIWNSMVSNVEMGFIQKGSAIYKAARLNWWGKEVSDLTFPQHSTVGLM